MKKKKLTVIGRIWKTGNAHVVTIPKRDLEEINLKTGEKVKVEFAGVVSELFLSNNLVDRCSLTVA